MSKPFLCTLTIILFTALLLSNSLLAQGQPPTIVVTSPIEGSVTANVMSLFPGNGWSVRASAPTTRLHAAAVHLNGRIYLIGGAINGVGTTEVRSYDPVTDTYANHAPVSLARYAGGAATVNGKVYFAGGRSGSTYYNTVEEYDSTTDTWVTKAPMLYNCAYYTLVELDGKLYQAGGFGNSSTPWNDGWKASVYDPPSDSWTQLPQPVSRSRDAVSVAYDGKLHLIGGWYYVGTTGWHTMGTHQIFDPSTNAWTTGPGLPRTRAAGAGVIFGDKLHYIGGHDGNLYRPETYVFNFSSNSWSEHSLCPTARGYQSTAKVQNKAYLIQGGSNNGNTNIIEVYDPLLDYDSGLWSQKADMPTGRLTSHAVASVSNRIYVIGGYNSSYMNVVDEYDPATNSWRRLSNKLTPHVSKDLAAAESNGKIYVFGGSSGAGTATDEYDPVTDTWRTRAPMLSKSDTPRAVTVGDKIYVIALNQISSPSTQIYSPETNTWVWGATMPTPRSYVGLAVIGKYIYAIGGYNWVTRVSVEANERYDTESDTWTTLSSVPRNRRDYWSSAGVAVSMNGKIFLIGGTQDGVTGSALFDIYDPVLDTWSLGREPGIAGFDYLYYHRLAVANNRVYAIGGNSRNRVLEYSPGATVVRVSGTLATSSSAEVIINDKAATVDGNSFSAIVPIREGPESLHIESSNASGTTSSDLAFIVDTNPPNVAIVEPSAPTTTEEQYFTIKCVARDNNLHEVLIDGQLATLVNGLYEAQIHLDYGDNVIQVRASDLASHEATTQTTVHLIYTGPTLSITSPSNNSYHNSTPLTIQGQVYDTDLVSVSANGIPANVNGTTYTVEVPLTLGQQEIVVSATDGENQVTTATISVIYDTSAPEEVTNTRVTCLDDKLIFRWTNSVNSAGDLASYNVYLDDSTSPTNIPKSQISYEVTGLSHASAHELRVAALDYAGNESAGAIISGVTLIPNPSQISVTPHSGYVTLSWDPVQADNLLKEYRVYLEYYDFNNLATKTPKRVVTTTTASIGGLQDNRAYYAAVVTVNISDGVNGSVITTVASSLPDQSGPSVSNITFAGQAFSDGFVLRDNGTFSFQASDSAGISQIEVSIDSTVIDRFAGSKSNYSTYFDVVALEDGPHTVTIVAKDSFANTSTHQFTVQVTLDIPSAPTITEPQDGKVTDQNTINVFGQAVVGSEVIFYNNGTLVPGVIAGVNGNGSFGYTLPLTPGNNELRAACRTRAGTSTLSAAVNVNFDEAIPNRPGYLYAEAVEGGVIELTWSNPADASVVGYNVYRGTNFFDSQTNATKINQSLITTLSIEDLPTSDGLYYYRVTSVANNGKESPLSSTASAAADSTLPSALSITYQPPSPLGVGDVNITLETNEKVENPFLSINPVGGTPLPVQLVKESDTTYSGSFTVSANTPTGTAYAVFSATDSAGNKGTEVTSGATVHIDTRGPVVTRLEVTPLVPIKNDENAPVTITVTLGLDEPVKDGTQPSLSYLLSGNGRTPVTTSNIVEIATQAGDGQTWQTSWSLLSDAGLGEAETFSFQFTAEDELGNSSDKIECSNEFQVYQGQLPPLAVPANLTASSLAGGGIQLSWNLVQDAAGYRLYRQGQGETELTALLDLPVQSAYLDEPVTEGKYFYAVASIRELNGEKSASGMSNVVEVSSDATAPDAPTNLTLELVGGGVSARWTAPPFTESFTYKLYRADALSITTVNGLTPVKTGIALNRVVDANPDPTKHCYAVTAIDTAGNESLPSNSEIIAFDVLPVASMLVRKVNSDLPTLTWSHPNPSILGYDLIVDSQQINSAPLAQTNYLDSGYTGDDRTYTLVAINAGADRSPARSIVLPKVTATLLSQDPIKRGLMNKLEFQVKNDSAVSINQAKLTVLVDGRPHSSAEFAVTSGATNIVPLVVGGYESISDVVPVTSALEITFAENETVEIINTYDHDARDGMLRLTLTNKNFVRGATGQFKFTLENTSLQPIDLVLANSQGPSTKGEFKALIKDGEDNVISSTSLRQTTGTDLITLPDGRKIIRLLPSGSFTSPDFEIAVPSESPDVVTLELVLEKIRYQTSEADEIVINGPRTSRAIGLNETEYYAEIDSITPLVSRGDEDITIVGRAVPRTEFTTGANRPVKLVIANNGFERTYIIYTDDNAQFSKPFRPLPGESGLFKVSAMHPSLDDRPEQSQFTVNTVTVTPSFVKLHMPRNYQQKLTFKAKAGAETDLTNLQLAYVATDQQLGSLPQGVHVELCNPIATLSASQTATLTCTIWADSESADVEKAVLSIRSDESGLEPWTKIPVDLTLSQAYPVLTYSPNYLETGLPTDGIQSENFKIKNEGLTALVDLRISLLEEDKSTPVTWGHVSSQKHYELLQIGDEKEITITLQPQNRVTEGIYRLYLHLQSSNHTTIDIPVLVSVTNSGVGNIAFHVSDIYTETINQETQEPILGVDGAKIKIQNEKVLTIARTVTTSATGNALITDLPAGSYLCRVTYPGVDTHFSRFWIRPGTTTHKEIFLESNLVNVEWSVVETTIQDNYTVELTATYATNVPAAVVVAKPMSTILPQMEPGDVYSGSYTLTNHGLIRADDINFTLPENTEHHEYILPEGLPKTLEPNETVTIPFRVVCLKNDSGESTGGGEPCIVRWKNIATTYKFTCTNGTEFDSKLTHSIKEQLGDCASTTNSNTGSGYRPPPPPNPDTNEPGDTGGFEPEPPPTQQAGSEGVTIRFSDPSDTNQGGGFGDRNISPMEEPIAGAKCRSKAMQSEVFYTDEHPAWETLSKIWHYVGCAVNGFTKGFACDETDLVVKVPGGFLSVRRRYYSKTEQVGYIAPPAQGNGPTAAFQFPTGMYGPVYGPVYSWYFDHGKHSQLDLSKLTINPGVNEESLIIKNNVEYKLISAGVWKHETNYIKKTGSEYKWENKSGRWKKYASDGRMISYGNKVAGLLATLSYSGDLVTGLHDRNGRQVIWYSYTNGQISQVRDHSGRTVDYALVPNASNKLLIQTVTTYPDSQTSYSYTYQYGGSKGTKITRIIDGAGRALSVQWDGDNGGVEKTIYESDNVETTYSYGYDDSTKEYYCRKTYPAGSVEGYGRLSVEEIWYNEKGEVKRIDLNGRTTQRINRTESTLISSSSAAGVTGSYTIKDTSIYDEKGNRTLQRQDMNDNLLATTLPSGETVNFFYGDKRHPDKPTQIIQGDSRRTIIVYNERGLQTKREEASGTSAKRMLSMTYYSNGLLHTAVSDGDTNTVASTTTFTYDSDGNIASITDGEGNTTRFLSYDAMGHALTIRDQRGNDWTYAYDNLGRLTSQTNPLGHTTTIEYDGANNKIKVTNPANKSTRFVYNRRNKVVEAIDPEGSSTKYTYTPDGILDNVEDPMGWHKGKYIDQEGRVLSERQGARAPPAYTSTPLSNGVYLVAHACYAVSPQILTHYTYDKTSATNTPSHLPIAIQYPSFTKKLYYDNNQRVVATTIMSNDSDPATETFEYDRFGNLTKQVDVENNVTLYKYDDRDRLTEQTDSIGGVTKYTYDNRDNVIAIEDPHSQVTRYVYDRANRLTRTTKPLGQQTSYEYDANGNKTVIIDARGQKTIHTYDIANRRVRTDSYPTSSATTPSRTINFTYDELNNLTGWNDGTVSSTYEYDDLKRKTKETVNYGPFSLSYSYEFYPNGAKKAFIGPDGKRIEYTLDTLGRLRAIGIQDVGDITYPSYNWNAPTLVQFPGGLSFKADYDNRMRIKGLEGTDAGQNPIFTRTFTNSPSGTITSVESEHGNYSYGYDHYRLTNAQNAAMPNEAYTYDNLNNRKTSLATGGEWTYDANNRLISVDGMTFDWDENGNMTRKSANGVDLFFHYDEYDRLAQVDDGQSTVLATYHYDPLGRRLWKDIAGIKTYYLYCNEGMVGEYSETGEELVSYGWAPEAQFCTDPLWQKRDGAYYWYQNDNKGTPWKLVDNSGAVVWQAVYDSFGNCDIQTSTVASNLRLPGQYFDFETGLYYNLNRYYDPVIGRYLQEDPAGDGLNPYTYAHGNPINSVDPFGLCAMNIYTGVSGIVTGMMAVAAACSPIGWIGGALMVTYGVAQLYSGTYSAATGEDYDLIGDKINEALPNSPYIAAALTFATHLGIPAMAGAMAAAGQCFVEGTPVLTKDGLKPIEDIAVGELVASFDTETGETVWKPVPRTFRRQAQEVLWLIISDSGGKTEQIGVTPEHPFYVHGCNTWVEAKKLALGAQITSFDDHNLRIVAVKKSKEKQSTYNFEVASTHCYYVGTSQALVHNVCGGIGSGSGTGPGNKDWKKLIEGRAHGTTPGHKFASYRKAIKMAKSGRYSKVFLNKGLKNAVEGIAKNRRPDTWGVRLVSGLIDMFEVPSKTDKVGKLLWRLADNAKNLGARAGNYAIIPIKK